MHRMCTAQQGMNDKNIRCVYYESPFTRIVIFFIQHLKQATHFTIALCSLNNIVIDYNIAKEAL